MLCKFIQYVMQIYSIHASGKMIYCRFRCRPAVAMFGRIPDRSAGLPLPDQSEYRAAVPACRCRTSQNTGPWCWPAVAMFVRILDHSAGLPYGNRDLRPSGNPATCSAHQTSSSTRV